MISLGEAADPEPWPITHPWAIKRCTWQMGMQPPVYSSYLESAFGYAFPCGFGIYSEFHQRKFLVLFKIHNYDQRFTSWADTWTEFYLVRFGLSRYLWLPLLSTLSWQVFPPPRLPFKLRIFYWPACGSSWGCESDIPLATRMGLRPNRAN